MEINFERLNITFKKASVGKSFLWLFLFFLLINWIEVLITDYLLKIPFSLEHQNFSYLYFLKAVLIAPLLETFIFQYVMIEISLYFKASTIQCILVSGLFFGLAHLFNSDPITYWIGGTIAGIYFGYVYFFYKRKPNASAFLMVFLLHSLFNFFVFLINNF